MPEPSGRLRVASLHVENFGGILCVDISKNDERLTLITGENGAGKTNTLDALESLLTGKRCEPTQVIRTGETEARASLVLRDELKDRYSVEVVWKAKGPGKKDERTLTVKDLGKPMGKSFERVPQSPQSFLGNLLGHVGIHPLDFANTDAKGQASMLLAAAGLTETYETAKGRIAAAMESRKDAKKEADRLTAVLTNTPDPAPGETLEPVDVAAVQTELTAADAHNKKRWVREQGDLGLVDVISECEIEIAEWQKQIEQAREQMKGARQDLAKDEEWLAANPACDTEPLAEKIKTSTEHNEAVRKQTAHHEALADTKAAVEAAVKANDLVTTTRKALEVLVSSSDIAQSMPGITIDETGAVKLNEILLADCSGSERVAVACQVLMANADGLLHPIFINEADGLGADALAAIKAYANTHDCDVWMTGLYPKEGAQVVTLADGEVVQETTT